MVKTFKVGGMMCDNCAKNVTNAISGVQGVSDVKVSLKDKNAVVTYDGKASDQQIMDAIEDAGYDALGVE